jgi:hypothetical protein
MFSGEENLCTECAEWHMRCEVFRSHHVIDLSSVESRIPPSSRINKKINIIILKFRLFKSLIARLLFVQSDVFCALCICSGVAKGYGCEDQALEMNRKLCTECAEWHLRCKVFRSHHVIDLSSVESRIPPSSRINCCHLDILELSI